MLILKGFNSLVEVANVLLLAANAGIASIAFLVAS
jgi:hypothetical protein